jgi:hypothetical protein
MLSASIPLNISFFIKLTTNRGNFLGNYKDNYPSLETLCLRGLGTRSYCKRLSGLSAGAPVL